MPNADAATHSSKRSILFVDDDAQFLQMLDRLMRLYSKNALEIYCAQNASSAFSILQDHPINLVVLDMCMPAIDGVQFLTILNRRYPGLQKIVLTGYATDNHRTAALSNGADLFLEKPRTSEGMETVFATFDELTRWQPETGFRGVLRRVGLLDVIQMECLGRTSAVLAVNTPTISGTIYIKEGAIVHAETSDLKGEEALKQLLTLSSGEFKHSAYTEPPEHTITGTWEALLMDAAQSRDETLGQAPTPGPEPAPPAPCPLPPSACSPFPAPTRIDEILICAGAGDVLHTWQCANTDLRISLLDFVSQKARVLQNVLPLGEFDRAEFTGEGARLVTQIGKGRRVVLRSSPASDTPDANHEALNRRIRSTARPNPEVKTRAQQWFQEHHSLPGVLAATLQFSDRTGLAHSVSPAFAPDALENLRRTVHDTYQVLRLQKFSASRARWSYDQTAIETAQWIDGTSVSFIISRQALELNTALINQQIESFLNQQNERETQRKLETA
jgi:ActR/RegA family two-component response regulator